MRAGLLAALLALVQPSCDVGKSRRFDARAFESALAGVRAATHRVRCPAGSWPVYSHDSSRSGASRGCCRGPLTPLWRFEPPPKPLRKARAFHAIVSKDAIYASGTIGESPALFAIGLDGRALWTFDSHVDITRYEWPAYVLDRVVLNDDGLYIIDPRTGQTDVDRGMDSWGQVIDDGKNLFATNTWYVAGPKTYVGALEPGGAPLWKHHEYGVIKQDVLDRLGGLALAQDRLLFAPNYHPAPGAGVYAYRSKDGGQLWSAETLPSSHASVAGESVYLFEHPDSNARPSLVCRDIDDGKVRWKIDAASPERAPPVVALGKALFRADGGAVVAVHRGDGTEAWRTALRAPEDDDVAWSTSLAAATGSGTLIAIDGTKLVVLLLQDGSVQWRGRPASAKGALHSPVIAGGRVYLADQSGIVALACAE